MEAFFKMKLIISLSITFVFQEKQDWNCNLITPADAIILKPKASNPKRKRKLYVDGDIILTSQEMKNNMATPDTLIRVPVCCF